MQLISEHVRAVTHISLMKQQFVVTRNIRQTEIPALLHSWVYKYALCQNVVSTKTLLLFTHSRKVNMLRCWSINDLSNFLQMLVY